MRTCVACRTAREKRDLVRIVRQPNGGVVFDETGRLAGRGAYLCRDGSCWTTALARGVLERALRAPLSPEVRARLEAGADEVTTPAGRGTMEGLNGGIIIGKE